MRPQGLNSYSSSLSSANAVDRGTERDPLTLARERLAAVRNASVHADERDESNELTPSSVEPWNAGTARLLIGACYRRVAAAWNDTPPDQRPEVAYAALAPYDAVLWSAYNAHWLDAVRRAIGAYEQAAEPIFVAWRTRRDAARG